MKTFDIDKSFKTDGAGVYLITFPCGHFYIGSTQSLNTRIKTHIASFNSKREKFAGCKSLFRVRDFDGTAKITLLQRLPIDKRGQCSRRDLIKVEYAYIEAESDNPLLLNDPRNTGNSRGLGVHVKKHVHQKIKQIAEEKGLKLSEYVERLLRQAIKDHEFASASS
jgi:hypothetical protein